jgi:hypothetical protein
MRNQSPQLLAPTSTLPVSGFACGLLCLLLSLSTMSSESLHVVAWLRASSSAWLLRFGYEMSPKVNVLKAWSPMQGSEVGFLGSPGIPKMNDVIHGLIH